VVQQVQPIVIGVPLAPDYYYSVGDGLYAEERERRIAEAVIRRFGQEYQVVSPGAKSGMGSKAKAKAKAKVNSAPAPSPLNRDSFRLVGVMPVAKQSLPPPARDSEDVAAINQKVQQLFEASCLKCHKPGASKPGNIQIFTSERELFFDSDPKKESLRRLRVYESVESGDMPRGAPPWTPQERAILKQWYEMSK
jgi:hypothetical protein